MRVYVDGKWHDYKTELLVVELTDQDKKNIKNMNPDCTLYAQYEENYIATQVVVELLEELKKMGG